MSERSPNPLAVDATAVPPTQGCSHSSGAVRLTGLSANEARPRRPVRLEVLWGESHESGRGRVSAALHHRHSVQDEFVYIPMVTPTLVTEGGEVELGPGMCAGFPASGSAHHLERPPPEVRRLALAQGRPP